MGWFPNFIIVSAGLENNMKYDKKQINLSGQIINYFHKHISCSRRLKISIGSGEKIIVSSPARLPVADIEKFLYQHADWILKKLDHLKKKTTDSIFPKTHKDFLLNKSKALRLVREKLDKLNKIYNFKYNKITIRNVSSRWGSCSRRGNLNFNYKIVFLPDEMAEYIVAHELCHLKEMNHSARFWRLVGRTILNWPILRRRLKNIF